MKIIYDLPDYYVEGAERLVTNSTADYIFDDLIVIN